MWQQQILEAIRNIDTEQAPHGLYGLPGAMASPGRSFTPLGEILTGNETRLNPALRLGWRKSAARPSSFAQAWRRRKEWDLPSGEPVGISYLPFAATKVRHYGDSYQLDRVHGQKDAGDLPTLESRLTHLRQEPGKTALIVIAHVPLERRFETLLGKTTATTFLERYALQHYHLVWEDRQGRGFFTGLFLWSADGGRE